MLFQLCPQAQDAPPGMAGSLLGPRELSAEEASVQMALASGRAGAEGVVHLLRSFFPTHPVLKALGQKACGHGRGLPSPSVPSACALPLALHSPEQPLLAGLSPPLAAR